MCVKARFSMMLELAKTRPAGKLTTCLYSLVFELAFAGLTKLTEEFHLCDPLTVDTVSMIFIWYYC